MSDLETLTSMGFEPERAALAVKQTGGLQGAIDWLEKNQEKSLEEIKADPSQPDEGAPSIKPGDELAKSLICNDCGKQFRSTAQAEFHASKTEHQNFSESTVELAPLTEEQKKEKLAELYAARDRRKVEQAETEKAERKRNEEIKRKSNVEQQDAKEQLARKEQIKDAEKKRREKQADIEAKKRIQAKIAADKEERRRRAETEKAAREGQTFAIQPLADSMPVATPKLVDAAPSKPASAYTTTRLRLQTSAGTVQGSYAIETTLFEVAQAIGSEKGIEVSALVSTYPKKEYSQADFGMTLKEAGLVPSAALIVK